MSFQETLCEVSGTFRFTDVAGLRIVVIVHRSSRSYFYSWWCPCLVLGGGGRSGLVKDVGLNSLPTLFFSVFLIEFNLHYNRSTCHRGVFQ